MKIERVIAELEERFGKDERYEQILLAITDSPHETPLADKFSLYMMTRIMERNGRTVEVVDDL